MSEASNAERLVEALGPAFASVETEIDAALIEGMIEAIAPLAADDVVGVMSGMGTVERELEGLDGLRALWADWLGTFARVRFEIEGVEQIGDNVFTLARQIGTTRHGVDIEQPSAAVWKFRQGQLVRIEFHLDRELAHESARQPA